jgi:hypothetical protein
VLAPEKLSREEMELLELSEKRLNRKQWLGGNFGHAATFGARMIKFQSI